MSVAKYFLAGTATMVMAAVNPAMAESVKIDVGSGTIVQDNSQPLSVALFLPSTANSYLQNAVRGAQDAVKKTGGTVKVFDAKMDFTSQINQLQNAIQSGQYNALIVLPYGSELICSALTQKAREANILVTAVHEPICGKMMDNDDKLYTPGLLQLVGGASTYQAFQRYLADIVKDNPGAHKLAIVTGFEIAGDTRRFDKALSEVKATNPNLKVVSVTRTNYSLPDAASKMQNVFQANPDIDVVISTSSALTQGTVNAIKQAGKTGKIKVYDFGGTTWAKAAVESGDIVLSVPQFPYSMTYQAVENIAVARQGKQVPRFLGNDGGPASAPEVINKETLKTHAAFKPEYD